VADIAAWQPVTGAARLARVPQDRWRVDVEPGRERVDTPQALAERVSLGVASIGVDFRPAPRWALTGALAELRFDEGNRWSAGQLASLGPAGSILPPRFRPGTSPV